MSEKESNEERKYVSSFTLVHFLTGWIARKLGVPLAIWITVHTIFEIWENSKSGIDFYAKKDSMINKLTGLNWPTYDGDALPNSLIDTMVTVWGWIVADVF